MTDKQQNDFFYVCSLIEYTARKTKNKRGAIIDALGRDGVQKQLKDAQVNHCLSFEQVSDEIIEIYNITPGDFDTITNCKYTIPGFMDIGRLYSIMIEDCTKPGEEVSEMIKPSNPLSAMIFQISRPAFIIKTQIIKNVPIKKVDYWSVLQKSLRQTSFPFSTC